LEKDINNFTVLIDGSPQVMPMTLDLHEYLVNEKGIAIPLMLPSQSLGVFRSEFVAPQTVSFVAYLNATLRQ
jgi:hypothetical protein